jgi:RNA chaperone Hfq
VKKQQFNIQDRLLNESRKAGRIITITLMDGNKLTGLVTSYDQYTIEFLSPNPPMNLTIFKQSIAFIKFS